MQTAPTQIVGRRKRSHEIAELLEKAIAGGEFEVGSQLPSEKVLAERFGVGRPSVREALFLLQQQGLVDVTSGTRARVTAPDQQLPHRPAYRLRQAHGRHRRRARARWSRRGFSSRRASPGRPRKSRPTRTSSG